MALVACYLDESADAKNQEVFAVTGVVGHLVNWFEVERAWEARLGKDGLDYFRAADCETIRGPFEKFRSDRKSLKYSERLKAESVRSDLIEIINRNHLLAAGTGILMKDFNEVIQDEDAKFILGDDPYLICYRLAWTRIADTIKQHAPRHMVAFLCDEHETYAAQALATYGEFKRKNPNIKAYMGTLSFMDDKKYPPVQTADLLAFEAMHKARQWLKGDTPEREQFKKLKAVFHRIDAADKNALINLVKNNRELLKSRPKAKGKKT